MGDLERVRRELSASQQYRALLAVLEAIVAHRDLGALFRELAGQLHQVLRFDKLILVLLAATGDTVRGHILESSGPAPDQSLFAHAPTEETPSGMVLRTQLPLIVSGRDQLARRCATVWTPPCCGAPLA